MIDMNFEERQYCRQIYHFLNIDNENKLGVDSLEKILMLGGIGGRRRRKGTTEDEMAGWHHRLHGRESE